MMMPPGTSIKINFVSAGKQRNLLQLVIAGNYIHRILVADQQQIHYPIKVDRLLPGEASTILYPVSSSKRWYE